MEILFPGVFSFVDFELNIHSVEINTFDLRKDLYSSGSAYYLEGTFTDAA